MSLQALALIENISELVEADMLVSVNVRLLDHLQDLLVSEVEPHTVEDELDFRGRNIAVPVLIFQHHLITSHFTLGISGYFTL